MPLISFIKKKIRIFSLLIIFLTSLLFSQNILANANITEIAFNKNNNLEISIDKKTDFKIFLVKDPWRLVVDIGSSNIASNFKKPQLPHFAKSFRSRVENNTTRLVFDLAYELDIANSKYQKIANDKYGKIIAIFDNVKKNNKASNIDSGGIDAGNIDAGNIDAGNIDDFIFTKLEEFDENNISSKNTTKSVQKSKSYNKATKSYKKSSNKKPIIVIDAGHGGKDPGAIGRYLKTKEKNITLSYARQLAKELNKTKKYQVYLTRHKDFFIPLRNRVAIARKKKADIFISLHANSAKNRKAKGFSIYTLSEKSSDKQAERLARKENRADIIHGINFKGASSDIMKTLIDLSQREAMNSSAKFANIAIRSVKKSNIEIIQNSHRFAGFAVLTAPDMASVLIELGYLTNKKEEKLLNSIYYKRKVAKSLVKAINEYFK